MFIMPYDDTYPDLHESVFIARGVVISGDVKIGQDSSVWYNSVIRGDVAPTIIGNRVNIQDNCTLHQSPNLTLRLEDEVTIGHNVVLHSCVVRRGALIGMGAIVLDGAEIGEEAMVAAGCLVPPGMKVPAKSLVMGTPAKIVREVNEADIKEFIRIRQTYVEKAKLYQQIEKQQNL